MRRLSVANKRGWEGGRRGPGAQPRRRQRLRRRRPATALRMAARKRYIDIFRALSDCGTAVNAKDAGDDTPLRRAVNCPRSQVCQRRSRFRHFAGLIPQVESSSASAARPVRERLHSFLTSGFWPFRCRGMMRPWPPAKWGRRPAKREIFDWPRQVAGSLGGPWGTGVVCQSGGGHFQFCTSVIGSDVARSLSAVTSTRLPSGATS